MTEITDNDVETDLIGPRIPALPKRHSIAPVAFAIAFITAPVVAGILFFWLFIPLFAISFGYPFWIIIGLPTLLWQLPRTGPDASAIAGMALLGNLVGAGLIWGYAVLTDMHEAGAFLYIFGIFGSVFAPLWGAIFAWLYRGLLPKPRKDLLRLHKHLKTLAARAQFSEIWPQSLATP